MKKTSNSSGHIVALEGGKKNVAYLEVEGEKIPMASFILAGENPSGKRVIYTWNASPDEITTYLKTLDVVVSKKIEQIMDMD